MKHDQMPYEVKTLNKKLSLANISREISNVGGSLSPTALEDWKVGDLLELIIPNGITLSAVHVVRHKDKPSILGSGSEEAAE